MRCGIAHRTAGIVSTTKELATALFVVGEGAKGVAHAIGAHHLFRQIGGALQIVGSTRGDLAENDLFSGATT